MKKALIYSENSYFSAYIKHMFTPYGIKADCITNDHRLEECLKNDDISFIVFDSCMQNRINIKLIQQVDCPLIIMNSLDSEACPNQNFTPFLELLNSDIGQQTNVEELAPHTFFDVGKHCIWRKEEYIPLAAQEFKILYLLYLNIGQTVSSEELVNYADLTSRSSLYVHINSLREKIEENCGNPQIIITKFGKGYQICKHKAELKLLKPQENSNTKLTPRKRSLI